MYVESHSLHCAYTYKCMVLFLYVGILCQQPKDPVDGSVTWESRGIIRYSCDPGFSLVGASVQMCLSSGEWNDSMPMCASDSSDGMTHTHRNI